MRLMIAALIGSFAFLAFRVVVLSMNWRKARGPAPVPLSHWRVLPRRYLVNVHAAVQRRRGAAVMHMLIAGGMTASVLLLVMSALLGSTLLLTVTFAIAMVAVAVGACLELLRRWPQPIVSLSPGVFAWLPAAFLAFAITGLWVVLGAPFAGVAALLNAFAIFLLIGLAADGPLRHAIAGATHLVAHERPERFTPGGRSVGLQPLPLASEKLGARERADFSWVQQAGFDSCVECGRCEEACPAFAAELPLNPKALIQDLARRPAMAGKYRGHGHPGLAVDGRIRPETIWACTTCRACVEACPMFIEHVDAIVEMRRYLTLEQGATSGKGPEVLEALALTGNQNGRAPRSRMDWAADLVLPLMRDVGSARMLLWMGEGAFDLRNQRTLRALCVLMKKAGEEFAVLGEEEWDTGDTALRLGDEPGFRDAVARVMGVLSRYRFERIVTADPHVLNVFRNDYRRLGFEVVVEHHSQYLLRMVAEGRLTLRDVPAESDRKVTYHDPCYLGRYNGEYDAPRALLAKIGVTIEEMPRSRSVSRCCGGGGAASITDVAGKRRIADVRTEDIIKVGADIVAVACPNCAVMLEGSPSRRAQVADIAELIERAVSP
jgi:Fe-S oxidoreductase